MITILSMLEEGYESSFEHLAFRQLKGAYLCNLVCVPHDYATLSEALSATAGKKIFMVPPGRVIDSVEFSGYVLPEEDVVFVFGSPQESLVSHITPSDTVLHIETPGDSVMMAVCVAAIVLEEHGY